MGCILHQHLASMPIFRIQNVSLKNCGQDRESKVVPYLILSFSHTADPGFLAGEILNPLVGKIWVCKSIWFTQVFTICVPLDSPSAPSVAPLIFHQQLLDLSLYRIDKLEF